MTAIIEDLFAPVRLLTQRTSWRFAGYFQSIRALLALAFMLIAGGMSGCTTVGEVPSPTLQNESVVTPELRDFLKKHPRPAIALHAKPLIPQQVTASSSNTVGEVNVWNYSGNFGRRTKSNSTSGLKLSRDDDYRRLTYDELEKELIRSGFIVRDRNLLNTLLANKKDVDAYAKIGERIKADIILEISDLDFLLPFRTYDYFSENGVRSRPVPFVFNYNRIRGKIVIVEHGQLGGTFEFAHCSNEQITIWVSSSGRIQEFQTPVPAHLLHDNTLVIAPPSIKSSAQFFTENLIKILRPTP
jgi:hypothetical protein